MNLPITVDSILERLAADWHTSLDAWPILVALALVVAVVVWTVARLSYRRQTRDLQRRLEEGDRRLAEVKARLAGELKALEEERQGRQSAEAMVASLREQLASHQRSLAARCRPTQLSHQSSARARYDDLFGPGPAVGGRLPSREAERLVQALEEISDLMRSRLEADGSGPMPRTKLVAANGAAWWAYVARQGMPHAIDLVAAYRKDVIDFANALEAIITRQADLEFRLRNIVGNVGLIAALLNVAGGYIRSMERLNDGESYKPAVLEMALGRPFQILVQAETTLQEWMRLFVGQRVPAVRQEVTA